jgi:DNA-binding CsgD family transcriptional regulator
VSSIDALLSSLPFVGRSAELSRLDEALRAAAAGHGNAVILAGESGIGKTRLSETAAARAEKKGFGVALGRAYPVETGVPYAPFADALIPVLRKLDRGAIELLSRGGMAELSSLFPGFSPDGVGRSQSHALAEPAELKSRLLWTFSQFLSRYAAKQPLLLVLENLQWADPSSLELLHFLARQLGTMKIVLLCSYNSAQRDDNAVLRATEESLLSLGAVALVRLDPLVRAEVDELLRRVFRVDPATIPEFAALLFERTRGSPFFIAETLKALVESGRLREEGRAWVGWELDGLELPRTIRDALVARVDRLPAAARAVAEMAAVIGARASWDALRAVTMLGRPELLAALDELRRAHVLVESTVGDEVVYDFSHPLLRETIYVELGVARTRQLHATVAEALERHYGERAVAHADELAFQFARADADDLASKAARYLTVAGQNALGRRANREAANYLDAAAALTARLGIAPEPGLLEDLARARQRAGDYDGAYALWQRVLASATTASDDTPIAVAQRRMGLLDFWRGRLSESMAHLDAGLDAATRAGNDPLATRVLVTKGVCLQQMGDAAASRAALEDALLRAQRSGEPATLARVHRAIVLLHVWTGASVPGRESAAQALALAADTGDRSVAWSAHWALATLLGLTGNVRATKPHMEEAHRIAEELRSPLLTLWSNEISIEYGFATGDWQSTQTIAERSMALARALDLGTLLPRLLVWASNVYLARGDIERGRAYVMEAWELSGAGRARGARIVDIHTVVPAHFGLANYHLTMREYDEALRVAADGLEIADRSGYAAWAIHRLLPLMIEASLRKRDFEGAMALSDRLRGDAERVGHTLGLAWAEAGSSLAMMLRGKSTPELLLRVIAAAEAIEAIPFVFDAAKIRREIARRYMEFGDRENAMVELRRVHDVFARLGAEDELTGTRDQMRALGARPPSRSMTAGAAGLTGRELEIIVLVSQRKSNKDIGSVLGISPRTVSTHLSNIFEKTGVASRGELTDFARSPQFADARAAQSAADQAEGADR